MTDASQQPGPSVPGPYPWQPSSPVAPPQAASDPLPPSLTPPLPQRRRPGRATAVAGLIGLAVTALGAPLGLLWALLAPSVPVRMSQDGALLVDAQPEEFIAADGWFSVLGLGFGIIAAIGVWLVFRRWRGPLSMFALAVGAIGAGLLAWWLGRRIGLSEYERLLDSAAVDTVFGKPADLRAAKAELAFGFLPVVRGDVLVPAFAAVVVYTLLAGWSRFPSLRSEEQDDAEFVLEQPPYAAGHPVRTLPGPVLGGSESPSGASGSRSGWSTSQSECSGSQPEWSTSQSEWSGVRSEWSGVRSGSRLSSDPTATPAPPAAPAPPAPGEATPPPG